MDYEHNLNYYSYFLAEQIASAEYDSDCGDCSEEADTVKMDDGEISDTESLTPTEIDPSCCAVSAKPHNLDWKKSEQFCMHHTL